MDNQESIPLTITGTILVSKDCLNNLARAIVVLPSEINQVATDKKLITNAVTKSGLPRLAYSIHETAEVLGVSDATVYRFVKRGLLKNSSASRHKMISVKEIERFLRDTTTAEY